MSNVRSLSLPLVALFFFLLPTLFSQNRETDSLLKKLAENSADTNRVNALNGMANVCLREFKFSKALKYSEDALALATKLNHTKGFFDSYQNAEEAYQGLGNYAKAMEFSFKALKKAEQTKNAHAIAGALSKIGTIYWYEANYQKSLEFYLKSFEVAQSIEDYHLMQGLTNNIGLVYRNQGNNEEALKYYMRSKQLADKAGNRVSLANTLNNIGVIYQKQKDYEHALSYHLNSLKLREELSNKIGIATSLDNIGAVYLEQNDLTKAEEYFKRSLKISESIHDLEGIKEVSDYLSQLYLRKKDGLTSIRYYKEFIKAKETLINEETRKETYQLDLKYKYEAEKLNAEKEQEKKDLVVEKQKEEQQIVIYAVSGVLIVICIFSIFLFNRFKVTQKQKNIIELQKELVETKQKQIMESINYARRIQDSIMVPEKIIRIRIPELFILYKPKDIVSGDFYWFSGQTETEVIIPGKSLLSGEHIIVAADCTGHGIPGAFLSMAASTLLHEVVNHMQVNDPAEIIKELAEGFSSTLMNHEADGVGSDGMDISICKVNFKSGAVQFAGANHFILIVNEKGIERIESQINSVNGIFDIKGSEVISSMKLSPPKGSMMYIGTDGYADQIGGEKGKKFMSGKFEELLASIHHLSIDEQKRKLDWAFNDWKGENKQVDDVLVVGFRI